MFGIPLPWILVGLSIALFGTYRGGYHFGWTDRDQEMQIEIAKKNEEARTKEQELAAKLNDKEAALRKATNEISKKQSAMRELVRAGELRLPAPSCVQASTNTTPATGVSTEDAAELERQTINALIDIVAEGDKAIVRLNQCISAYDEVRNLINGNR
jgi:hypothetical protein